MKIIIREWDLGKEINDKITAIGSFLVGSAVGTLAELAIGTHGQKLVVDLLNAKKVKWADQDGWVEATGWVWASATTITIPAGGALKYSVGMKWKVTSNSVVLYGYIRTVADTLLTVVGDTLTNYDFTGCAYSAESNPLGFPGYFSYTPTGISAANITLTGRFCVLGRRCFVDFKGVCSGALTYTTAPTLPIPASASLISSGDASISPAGNAGYWDNGTAKVPYGLGVSVLPSGTTFTLCKTDGTVIAATVPITWAANDIMEAHFSYEI